MNTTVIVETVHGIRDVVVVGSNGIVSVTEPVNSVHAESTEGRVKAPNSDTVANVRPLAK